MGFKLNDPLVNTYTFQGKEYSLNLAFDTVLDCYDAYKHPAMDIYDKMEVIMKWLFGDEIPTDDFDEQLKIWEDITQNIIGSKEETIQYDLAGEPMDLPEDSEAYEQTVDLEYDAELIYAAFLQAYRIDLINEQGKLHWTKFIALLHGLPEETPLKKIMDIRGTKLEKIKDKSTRDMYREQKEKLRIPTKEGR